MFRKHSSRRLAADLDGQLTRRESQLVELHVRDCADCREEREQVKTGMQAVEHLPLAEAPDAIWSSIEAALGENQSRRVPMNFRLRWAVAIVVGLMALGTTAYWRFVHRHETRWEVQALAGLPAVGAKRVHGGARIGAGEWIETNERSRATVKVGTIGSVDVEPNTRVRVAKAKTTEYRLALERGEIQAKISAPPRLFFVDTPSGTAVDLGCEYTLSSDENGSGLLQVTRGWVSFQWKELESLVPAGASCRMRSHAGPGLPYFDDAPEHLKQAADNFGFENAADGRLGTVLAESRVRDTLTLWHLLSRVEPGDRGRVFDRIAALTPVPAGISRDLVLRLDPETLRRWKDELAWTW